MATSRARAQVRRARAWLVGGFALLVVIGIAAGLFGAAITFAVVTLLIFGIPVALVGGLLRLIRTAGVTVQVVAGALAVYLVVGLLFASIIAFAATVESSPYFTQGKKVSNGERVYYSFTVLTTTGFGDFTAAQPFGHALAVLEMLTGQLYLVTVIGIVVGNFAGRRTARDVGSTSTTGPGGNMTRSTIPSPIRGVLGGTAGTATMAPPTRPGDGSATTITARTTTTTRLCRARSWRPSCTWAR